ncbi:MAG: hypothetical protein ACK553_14560 [Planctomycetota bacterium]|jgi:phosphodiesterase/alkaline phosphatase D-like protein
MVVSYTLPRSLGSTRSSTGIENGGSLAVLPLVSRITLGVASGDPSSDSLVLAEPIEVRWEIAADDAMQRIVPQGMVTASLKHKP